MMNCSSKLETTRTTFYTDFTTTIHCITELHSKTACTLTSVIWTLNTSFWLKFPYAYDVQELLLGLAIVFYAIFFLFGVCSVMPCYNKMMMMMMVLADPSRLAPPPAIAGAAGPWARHCPNKILTMPWQVSYLMALMRQMFMATRTTSGPMYRQIR